MGSKKRVKPRVKSKAKIKAKNQDKELRAAEREIRKVTRQENDIDFSVSYWRKNAR